MRLNEQGQPNSAPQQEPSDQNVNAMNIEQFAGNQFSSMDEQPASRDRQRNANSRGSNRILEPLFPPAGKSQQNFNSNN
jgi:hypothetical protein